ncbi:MAG: hypothetical protein E7395_00040 [Ruminococcaceae bacterium]|nr:hypothetical protein [Oscillospiraceae bacterium]
MRTAFYESDITPPLGCYIPGHYKDIRAVDVANKLYAKAVVIENEGNIAAMVCVDAVTIPPEMHDIVTKRVNEYTGITADNICICCNHSHSGAPIESTPDIGCFEDEAYKDVFFRLSADAIILAYKRLDNAEAYFANTEVKGFAYNRTFILDDGTYVTHGRGKTNIKENFGKLDHELGVLMFEKDGKPIGAIINYSCHQCCMNQLCNHYSGDFASIISDELKKIYGQGFVSLFIEGCCGDVNHVNPDINVPIPDTLYIDIGKKLAAGVIEALKNPIPTTGKVAVVKESVTIPKRQPDQEAIKNKIAEYLKMNNITRMRNMLYYTSANKTDRETVYVQAIRIGDTCIYALPGEIFAETGLKVKAQSPFKYNLVSELTNTRTGYIPPKRAFGEHDNLYETSLCFDSYFVPEAEDILIDMAHKVSQKLIKF